MTQTLVNWIPAHTSSGSVSMRRYWQALEENLRKDDAFQVDSLIRPLDTLSGTGLKDKANRFFQRRVVYPALIRKAAPAAIYHILDHSWADMLKHVPKSAKKVVTVHDLIPLRFPGELKVEQLARFRSWVDCIKLADAVISVSQYTKGEVVSLLGISPAKIHVIANGTDIPLVTNKKTSPWKCETSEPFRIGSIGSTLERKNLSILPESLEILKKHTCFNIELIRAGKILPDDLAAKIRAVIGNENLIELGMLTDAEVAGFYKKVDVVVVPSLYEGFGLPVLEAMACMTPVVCSNTSSLPEVGGEHVIYFDPLSASGLAECLIYLCEHGSNSEMIEAAYMRATQFSWRASLEGIFKVYKALLGSGYLSKPDFTGAPLAATPESHPPSTRSDP